MSHWYRFNVPEVGLVICKAERKAQIEQVLAPKIKFMGCVAREKIGPLRDDPHHTVFNSLSRLREVMGRVAPQLLRNPQEAKP